MRRLVPPLALTLILPAISGCESAPRDRLQGRWVGQRVEEFGQQQQHRATGWARGMAMEFRGSRVTVTIPAESPRTGSYKITQAIQDELTLDFRRPTGVSDTVMLQFLGDQSLRWKLADGRCIVMRKVHE